MKEIKQTKYQCSLCKEIYGTKEEALGCELKSVSQDKGAKIGDKVEILSGQGEGEKAIIDRISIIGKYWGHYAWKQYWHTVAVNADIIGSYAGRMLLFDSYKLIKKRR